MAKLFESNANLLNVQNKAIWVESARIIAIYRSLSWTYKMFLSNHQKRMIRYWSIHRASYDCKQKMLSLCETRWYFSTLLVYSPLLIFKLQHGEPHLATIQQTVALRTAANELSKEFTKLQVQFALNIQNRRIIFCTHTLTIKNYALVHRSKTNKKEDLLSVLDLRGKNVTMLLKPQTNSTNFWNSIAIPYHFDNNEPRPN